MYTPMTGPLLFIVGMSTHILLMFALGSFQIFDPNGDLSSPSYFETLDTQGFECTTATLSSTGQMMFAGDAAGGLHLWGTYDEATINPYSLLTMPDFPVDLFPPKPAMYINYDDPHATSKYALRKKNKFDGPLLSEFDPGTNNRVYVHSFAFAVMLVYFLIISILL